MKKLVTLLCLFFSQSAFTQCYIAEDFKGMAALSNDNYSLGKDGFTGKTFQIIINGSESRISSNGLKCKQISVSTVLCLDSQNGKSVVETWSVDLDTSKALYTKSISGYGKYDGVKAFVGRISGTCK